MKKTPLDSLTRVARMYKSNSDASRAVPWALLPRPSPDCVASTASRRPTPGATDTAPASRPDTAMASVDRPDVPSYIQSRETTKYRQIPLLPVLPPGTGGMTDVSALN